MAKVKSILSKSFIFIVVLAILTMSFFVCFNKPKQVKAEALTVGILGVGALATLVASYFAVAGVELTQNGGDETYFEGFINDTVNKFKQADADHKAMVEKYFDDQGRYIGTEEDLQFVLTDQARGYWNMGKELNQTLESIKNWFVTDNSLSVGTTQNFVSGSVLHGQTGDYFLYPYWTTQFTSYPPSLVGSNIGDTAHIVLDANHVVDIEITSGTTAPNRRINWNWGTGSNWYGFDGSKPFSCFFMLNTRYNYVTFGLLRDDFQLVQTDYMNWRLSDLETGTISLDGTLTDGYQDFQDALDQDLANEQDNENAVVGVGVGDLGLDTTADNVLEKILAKILAGELNPTYEGVYEDQQVATEEQEGEKEFVPELPVGWVTVDGLEDFFPFCIPFDFASIVEFFDAPAEAPVIRWNMGFGGVFDEEEIVLDFSEWEPAAVVFRVLVVIGFLIFLILKTRDLIRG